MGNPWEKYQSGSVATEQAAPWTKYAAPAAVDTDTLKEHANSLDYKMAIAGAKQAESLPQYAGRFVREGALPALGATAGTAIGGVPGGMAGAALGETISQATGLTPAGSVIPEANKPDLGRIAITAGMQGAIPLAAAGAKRLYGAAKGLVEPFYQGGRDAIIGRTLNTASGGQKDAVAQALMQARELVPGSAPTAGQAANNAGIASLERAASSIDPTVTVEYAKRMAEQNAARTGALRGIAGNDSLMADAVQARKVATAPFLAQLEQSAAEVNPSRTVSLIDRIIEKAPGRTQLTSTLENVKKSLYEPFPLEQRGKEAWAAVDAALKQKQWGVNDTDVLGTTRTLLGKVKAGKLDAETALSELKALKAATPETKDILSSVKDMLAASDQRLRSNAAQLYQGARKNITDVLNAKAGDGSKLNEAISRELSVVMKSLDNQIGKAEPAYKTFMNQYARNSEPINQMKVGQNIMEKSTDKLTGENLRPESFGAALSDKTAQQATGFKRATLDKTMTPQQMQTLEAVRKDLARAVMAQKNAGTAGSDTVKKLAYSNMIDRAGVPTFLREFAPTQIVGNILARGGDAAYSAANRDLSQQLAMTLLNPKEAARVMGKAMPSRYDAIVAELLKKGAPMTGATAAQMQNQRAQ